MYLSEIQKLDKTYIAHTYRRSDLGVASGSGAVAQDESGKQYIDFSSGIGVNALGFTPSHWAEAVKAQIDLLAHTSNLYYTQPMVALAKNLCERTGMARIFFANSGAEANEGAIKTARKYGVQAHGADCYEIITLTNSFHGRTIATLAATGQEAMHQHFGPFPGGFVYTPANDLAALTEKVSQKTCAILIECIQGEGGVVPLDPEFVLGIASICRQKDILLMVDEVQTGIGRTGTFLCCQQYGIRPDIITLAKGLGGGLPIGAVLFGAKTKDTLGIGDHGSTFGGNPVVCAGALAVLQEINGKFLDQVTEKGHFIQEQLAAIPEVTAVSGKGLMLGISLADPLTAADVQTACIKAGLIVLTAKQKIRFLPPLNISKQQIKDGLAIFADVLKQLKEAADEASSENERSPR